jgi:hypothetical protein
MATKTTTVKTTTKPKTASVSPTATKEKQPTPAPVAAPAPVPAPAPVAAPVAAPAPTEGKTEEVARFNMKSSIRNIKKAVEDLSYLTYELGRNNKLELEDGRVLTRKDIRPLKKGVGNMLDDMYNDYRNSKKKRTGSNKALLSPFFITGQLVDFFYNTDLGPAWRLNESTGQWEQSTKRLQDVLPDRGEDSCVVNQMILNGLFTIYYRTHKLPTNAGKIKADSDLRKYLGGAMKEIGVDCDAFNYFDFSKIRKHFKVAREDYTEELSGFLEQQATKDSLTSATDLVSSTVSYLKSREKERQRAEAEAKRANAPKKTRAKSAKQAAPTATK